MSKDRERQAHDEDLLALMGPDFSPRFVCGLIEAAPPFRSGFFPTDQSVRLRHNFGFLILNWK